MSEPTTNPPVLPEEEPLYFCFSATLRIFGEGLDIDDVTRTLRVQPTHSHRKGERRGFEGPAWPQDMWSFEPSIDESRPLDEHVMALWNAIRPHTPYLRALKQSFHVDVICGYRSNSNGAGFEVDYRCLGLFADLEVPFGISVMVA